MSPVPQTALNHGIHTAPIKPSVAQRAAATLRGLFSR